MQKVKTTRSGPLSPQFFCIQLFAFVLMVFLLWGFLNISHADSPEKDKAILAAQNYILEGTDDFELHVKNESDIPSTWDIISAVYKDGEKMTIMPESLKSRGDFLSEILIKHLELYYEPSEYGYTATYHAECTLTPEERSEIINDIVPDMASEVDGDTEKDMALSAAKVVAEHISYKAKGNLKREAFAKSVSDNEGVCRHYSVMYYLVLKELGIDSRTITGYLDKKSAEKGDRYHEWNAVKIDGEWYYADVTFFDQFPSSGYLLKPANDFRFKNRVPDEEYLWLTNQIKRTKKNPIMCLLK